VRGAAATRAGGGGCAYPSRGRGYSLITAITIDATTHTTITTCIQIQNRGISIPVL